MIKLADDTRLAGRRLRPGTDRLGHARRDIAIASELRRRHPDLEIDWLTQHLVTRMLGEAGERLHPASSRLASESAHIGVGKR
jgi:hypothetical protein